MIPLMLAIVVTALMIGMVTAIQVWVFRRRIRELRKAVCRGRVLERMRSERHAELLRAPLAVRDEADLELWAIVLRQCERAELELATAAVGPRFALWRWRRVRREQELALRHVRRLSVDLQRSYMIAGLSA